MESSNRADSSPGDVLLPNVAYELPRHHRPHRLIDIAEDFEFEIQDASSWTPFPNPPHKEETSEHTGNRCPPIQTTANEPVDRNSEFFEAIAKGDVGYVAAQIKLGANLEQRTDDDLSALAMAVTNEQVEIAKMLLEGGAKVHRRYRSLPLLVHALMQPNHGCRLLQLLLDYGATLNTVSGPNQKNALHWAAAEGMTEAVEFLLAKGMDAETRCSLGRTPLILAANANHVDVVKVLWAQGANLEAASEQGDTALHWSAGRNNLSILTFLLEKGADVNHTAEDNSTPLHLACHFGHVEAAKALLDAGADINARATNTQVVTPIAVATYMNHAEVVKLLLARGASFEEPTACSKDILEVALMEGGEREDVVKALLEVVAGPTYITDSVALQLTLANDSARIRAIMKTASIMYSYMEYGRHNDHAWLNWVLLQGGEKLKQTAMSKMLRVALDDRDLPLIKALSQAGCDIDVLLEPDHTALSLAVGQRDLELMKTLLTAGANPNKPIPDPIDYIYTPFDCAMAKLKDGCDTEVVDLLLETGRCQINKGRNPECTAFSYVLSKASKWAPGVANSLAFRMLDSVKDLDKERDDIGCSLLHVAVHHERKDILDELLDRGMNIDVVTDAAYTPFTLACKYSLKIVRFLVGRGANIHTKHKSNGGALHAAAVSGNVETLGFLLHLGLGLEDCTDRGYTPLASALAWGQEEAALELLRRGASTKWTTEGSSHTALHFAARFGMDKVVQHLLAINADVNVAVKTDVNALDGRGWSALHEACAAGNPATVKALLDAGADIEAPLSNGDRPLHVALISENEAVALLLIAHAANLDAIASCERNSLHLAAEYSLFRAAEKLLAYGPASQIEHVDVATETPLGCCGHVGIVKLLLKYGANVHYANKNGWTPLHNAVQNGEQDVALALIAAGAKLDDRTIDDGLTVLDRALDLDVWGPKGKGRMRVDPRALERAARRGERDEELEREAKEVWAARKRSLDEGYEEDIAGMYAGLKEGGKTIEEKAEERLEEKAAVKEEGPEPEHKSAEDKELEGLSGTFELVERVVEA